MTLYKTKTLHDYRMDVLKFHRGLVQPTPRDKLTIEINKNLIARVLALLSAILNPRCRTTEIVVKYPIARDSDFEKEG